MYKRMAKPVSYDTKKRKKKNAAAALATAALPIILNLRY